MRFRLYLCFSHGKNWRQLLLPLPFILKYIYLAYGQILFISLFVSLFLYLSVFICLLVFPHFTADKNHRTSGDCHKLQKALNRCFTKNISHPCSVPMQEAITACIRVIMIRASSSCCPNLPQ